MSGRAGEIDPISLEIMWSRLIGIADEMWSTVLRTAVSTIIGAAQDFGCEILDAGANSVAHSNRSMPSFTVIMPSVVRAVIARFPVQQMKPGDVYITNDPWICAGHLDDIATVTPFFHADRLVGFTATIAHSSSVGGSLSTRSLRDLYEEGLRIPVLKLYDGGAPNETAFAFIHENVRTPEMVLADLEALLAASRVGARQVIAFLDEYGFADLAGVASAVQAQSERAMRRAILALPDGHYDGAVALDGLDGPIRLRVRVTIEEDRLDVDYAGSDPQQPRGGGRNVPLNYTRGHTIYPLKCLLSPTVPANEGTFRPFTVRAPVGSILNCTPPSSVRSRHRTGFHLHSLLFRALEPVLPDRVQAGNGLMQTFNIYGQAPDGRFYNAHYIVAGGRGASLGRDGVSRNCYPSSARNVPAEILELRAPVLVRERGLLADSAGRGRWRGAYGQHLELGPLPGYPHPVQIFVDPDRLQFPPAGLHGGEDGPTATIQVDGRPISPAELATGEITLNSPAERITMRIPGGGGYGSPALRDPGLAAADAEASLAPPATLPVPGSHGEPDAGG